MPSVAQETPLFSTKKRRRDDDFVPLYDDVNDLDARKKENEHSGWQRSFSTPILESQKQKQVFAAFRTTDGTTHHDIPFPSHHLNRSLHPLIKRARADDSTPHTSSEHRHRPASPTSRLPCTTSTITTTTTDDDDDQYHHHNNNHGGDTEALQVTTANVRPEHARTTSAALLSPCHICRRRPSRKSELDDFADCEGCGQRTCFICIRQCTGWTTAGTGAGAGDNDDLGLPSVIQDARTDPFSTVMQDASEENDQEEQRGEHGASDPRGPDSWAGDGSGHRQMVCSRCCVERGADGDVVCLGCLPFVEG